MSILKEEMDEVVETSSATTAAPRSSRDQGDFSVEDLIAEEDMVITISHTGYIKRIPISTYKRQRRGGRGLNGADDQGRRLDRAPLHRQYPRLPDVLHQHRPGLLAQGARDSAGRPRAAAASRW